MKTFFILLIFLFVLVGCSSNNAFDNFKMDKDQQRSVSSLQTTKIVSSSEKVNGIFSAIYLNEVYPESFNDGEYFFVYMYLKKKKKMYNPKELLPTGLTLKLNSKLAVKIKELPKENKFSHLVSLNNNWHKYYLVAFMPQETDSLSLVLENDPSFLAELKYQKAEQ